MIKKLDKLVLKAFIGPFVATFFIACFVLMMQILWKYVDDLVGKGLDFITIGQFLWYASASLLTLAMPIAILISSIMTFGNLGESFELVAVKSSGISLVRFMRPLIVVSVFLCIVTFLFGNYVIPYANLKFVTLYNDIFFKKPAFELREGVFFTHIPGYAIKVDKKDPDGKTIHKVLIYEQNNPLQDNTIVAEKGTMTTSDDQNFLEFNLENGYRYQEKGRALDTSNEYTRLAFKDFKKLFDLSIFQRKNTDDSVFRNSHKMLSARQLQENLDSLYRLEDTSDIQRKRTLSGFFNYLNLPDSLYKAAGTTPASNQFVIPDSAKTLVNERAYNMASEMRNVIRFSSGTLAEREKDIRLSKIEWHRKYSLSLACLILFFIGAPLGSIIRKGGFGMPLVVAIIFFLIFHLLNMFGEKFVKQELMSPFLGMWLSVIVLIPVGGFLVYKAMHDSQLFNKEFYNRAFKKIRLALQKKQQNSSAS